MNWYRVDDLVKKKVDAKFVACTEPYELNYVLQVIVEACKEDGDDEIGYDIKTSSYLN